MASFVHIICLSFIPIWLIVPACVCGEPPRQVANSSQILERFKIATGGGPLLLPVDIQGRRFFFVMDTGSSRSFYDTSLRFTLGAPIQKIKVGTPDDDVAAHVFQSPAAKLGRLDLPANFPVCCMDLEGLRKACKEEFFGLLGMDFLRKYIVRIDFDRGEVTFLRSVGLDPGMRLPITFKEGRPHIEVEIPGLSEKVKFVVDTGWGVFNGTFRSTVFADLAKRGSLTLNGDARAESVSGVGTGRRGRVEAISLAGFEHKNLLFLESRLNVLGRDYLSRFVVTFDFPNSAIYLKKGLNYNRPDVLARTGMDIRRSKGLTWVTFVDESGPAASAGIHPRDVLLKINDAKIPGISLSDLRNLLAADVMEYLLLIQRDEKEFKVRIVLKRNGKRRE